MCVFMYWWSNHLFEEEWNIVSMCEMFFDRNTREREREDIETVFVLYVVHLITTVASEIRGFVTNKLLVALVTCICIVIDASELILTQKNNTLDLVNQY